MAQRDSDGSYNDMIGVMSIGSVGSSENKTTSGPPGFTFKDEDAIKLFVGQIPKHMDEDTLRPIFDDFGEIFDLAVIRDKTSGLHRGCAFLTYCSRISADEAIATLHGKRKLEQGQNPLQVRPADGQAEREHKLFVGMVPKSAKEDDIRAIFEEYGPLHEIHVIRNHDSTNKGCAFVKYATRESALAAIAALHDRRTMPGGPRPLVVKFANTKRRARAHVEQLDIGSPSRSTAGLPQEAEWWKEHPAVAQECGYAYPLSAPYTVQYTMNAIPHFPRESTQATGTFRTDNNGCFPSSATAFQPAALWASDHYSDSQSPAGNCTGYEVQGHTDSCDGLRQPNKPRGIVATSKPAEGPTGANLFINYLPQDLSDADLATAFSPFGTVLSAKVYIDRVSGESKGFGFVSYTDPSNANRAIAQMNGFQIGSKRLKVQHKRCEQFVDDLISSSGDGGGSEGYGNEEDSHSSDYTGNQDAMWMQGCSQGLDRSIRSSESSRNSFQHPYSPSAPRPWGSSHLEGGDCSQLLEASSQHNRGVARYPSSLTWPSSLPLYSPMMLPGDIDGHPADVQAYGTVLVPATS